MKKKVHASEIGGECGICGDKLGIKWVGYYWVCGNDECSRKAEEYEREFIRGQE